MKKAIQIILLFSLSTNIFSTEKVLFIKDRWERLSYSKIPANKVTFNDNKMNIEVNSSASPLVYPLKEISNYRRLKIKAKLIGGLNLGDIKQGEKGADDFRLRVGLVYQGDQTLGFFKRQIAADWILKLYSLAPKGTGVSRIEFFNTYEDLRLKDTKRPHPLADILKENFILNTSDSGMIDQVISIPSDRKVLAIWVSCDGDGTGSSFKVEIEDIELIK